MKHSKQGMRICTLLIAILILFNWITISATLSSVEEEQVTTTALLDKMFSAYDALKTLGITTSSIFPDLYGLAKELEDRFWKPT